MPTRGRTQFLTGLFLICMCGLMLQIIETRILSVIVYYYLAFFAIGMAMFGMTAGSLFVYFAQSLFPRERLLENLVWISTLFAFAVVGSALLAVTTVVTGLSGGGDLVMSVLQLTELVVMLATPYVFAGMAISLALTRSPWPVSLVYGVDLAGAATGCLAVLVVLTLIDAVSALILVGALGAVAGAFFAGARRARHPGEAPHLAIARPGVLPRPAILAVVFACLALGNAAIQPWGIRPSIVKGEVEYLSSDSLIFWNSFSRINVEPSRREHPNVWGPSPKMPDYQIEQLHMAIDGSAASAMYRFDGNLSGLEFLKYDITNLAYSIRHGGRAAVIGVGGGRDLLSAAYFGYRDITGVELNPIFVELLNRRLRGYNRLVDLPGMKLIVDDGRSWFARSNERFDLIQMSMVDTWAATGAGAFSLSENGLYTVEGWRVFFRHLTPSGVFTVSRWHSQDNIDEVGRMMSVADAALLDEGVARPSDHLFLAASDRLATLIVSRAPFTPAELASLTATIGKLGFRTVAQPHAAAASPVFAQIFAARSSAALERLTSRTHLDLSPSHDDRPFFFQLIKITDPWAMSLARESSDGVMHGNYLAVCTLLLIIGLSTALVLVTILVPSLSSVRRVARRMAFLGSAYFLLIGFGFMFVEMGLIQRISVYLGHPVYGLAIGLFGIIASTGAGSLLSARLPRLGDARIIAWTVALGLYLAALPVWFPLLVENFASAALPVRALVSLSAILPSGVLMGFGFPLGMQIVNDIDSRPTPWFWAVNGAAGVLASGLAVTVSIEYSISTTIWCAAVCYILLGPVAVLLSRTGAPEIE